MYKYHIPWRIHFTVLIAGAVIPERPYTAVYYRAHTIFKRSEKRGFSEEELEFIKK